MSNIQTTLIERGKTHGDFAVHALVTQRIKEIMKFSGVRWDVINHTQRESLEMIAHKIGRICAGNPNHIDHWDDIAGYATLVANELRRQV